uniref:Putative secreted protein n=1 Tax=Anopheles darlingi TaxID=43151 RepID=A0A2M4DK59_ANODA
MCAKSGVLFAFIPILCLMCAAQNSRDTATTTSHKHTSGAADLGHADGDQDLGKSLDALRKDTSRSASTNTSSRKH